MTFDPTSPGTPTPVMVDSGHTPDAVSCPSSSQCSAVDWSGNEVTFDPNSPGTPTPVPLIPGVPLYGVSCPSASQCTAVSTGGREVTFDPTSSGTPAPVVTAGGLSFLSVSCPSGSQCTAVSYESSGSELTFDPGSPGTATPVAIDAGGDGFWGVSCPTGSQCTAVDYDGNEVTFDPGSPGTATPVAIDGSSPAGFAGVSCPTTSQCTAVDYGGNVLTFDPTSPGTPTLDAIDSDSFNAISCPSRWECVAVDNLGNAFVGTGSPPPLSSSPPTISGAATPGRTLFASTGTWSGSPTSYGYQWRDCDGEGDSCVDIAGATSSAYTPGSDDVGRTIVVVVTATNAGGSTASTSPRTAVVTAPTPPTPPTPPSAPVSTAAPVVSGTPTVGHTLIVSDGAWTGEPSGYSFQWRRDGVAIPGATGKSYTVQAADQGHSISCTLTASDGTLSASDTTGAVMVPIVSPQSCPKPSGRLNGATLGPITLGLTQARARRMLPRFRVRSYYTDDFCLSGGWGIRVGYASQKLLGSTPRATLARIGGRIVLALTANPYYALHGVRPGARLSVAARLLKLGKVIHLGLNYWYIAPGVNSNGVLKVRHGVVEEVGIANRQLTDTRAAQQRLPRSF